MPRWRRREDDEDALMAALAREIDDERVLDAIAAVPRERFLAEQRRHEADRNEALPIACGQTISQPLVVARMTALLGLRSDDRVLDVGTGSGWHAAVLSRLCSHVWSIERHADLAAAAASALADSGCANVTVLVGDGTLGHPDAAPFDAINVAAAAADVPAALLGQLAEGGRLVAPVGAADTQRLVRVLRRDDRLVRENLDPVRFVPLVSGLP